MSEFFYSFCIFTTNELYETEIKIINAKLKNLLKEKWSLWTLISIMVPFKWFWLSRLLKVNWLLHSLNSTIRQLYMIYQSWSIFPFLICFKWKCFHWTLFYRSQWRVQSWTQIKRTSKRRVWIYSHHLWFKSGLLYTWTQLKRV